jgi:hypothetical protein
VVRRTGEASPLASPLPSGVEPRIALVLDAGHALLPTGTEVNRWVPVEAPRADAVEGVRQEVVRAMGYPAWQLPTQA